MAKKNIKISKEELEQDEVLEFADHAIFWFREHLNQILTVLCVGFLIYAVVVFLNQRSDSKMREASNLFYAAVQKYEANIAGTQWATEERETGMRQVIVQADEIIEKYGETPLARNALFLKGNAYYFMGDAIGSTQNTDEAIRVFEQYAQEAEAKKDGFERAAALLALGYAHENLFLLTMSGNREAAEQSLVAAVNYYDQIISIKKAGFLRYEALNAKGRLLEYLGREEDAKEVYRQVAKEHYKPVSPLSDEATQREQVMHELRNLANQFTTGRTAIIQLQRMGEDVEQYENPGKEASDGAS